MKFYPYKKGGGCEKSFSHPEGGGGGGPVPGGGAGAATQT